MHARTKEAGARSPRAIQGYDFGKTVHSPVLLEELQRLMATVGFTDNDRRALARAGEILGEQAEDMVDEWRAIIGSQEHLARWFFGPDGRADERYQAAVKPRFVRWVIDLCTRPFDQAWLDYQNEIALRHTPEKKNKTDAARTPPLVPLRYLLAFTAPVALAARARLQASGAAYDDVDAMHAAWIKAVVLSITLWSRPYTQGDLW